MLPSRGVRAGRDIPSLLVWCCTSADLRRVAALLRQHSARLSKLLLVVQAVNEVGAPAWTRVYNIPRYRDASTCPFVRLATANGQQVYQPPFTLLRALNPPCARTTTTR